MNSISLKGWDYSYIPKIVWQELFNRYLSHGGPVHNMHNVLVDYDNCKIFIDTLEQRKGFYWGCSDNMHYTTWRWEDTNPKDTLYILNSCDHFYHFQINNEILTIMEIPNE